MSSTFLNFIDNTVKRLPSKDEIIGLASIAVPPSDPLEQYLLDHENDLHMHERNEIDKIFIEQRPLLKHNFPIETLGGPPPPKGDPVFELKQLPDTLKYAYQTHEEERLLKVLRKHRAAIRYTLDDLKGISPTLC